MTNSYSSAGSDFGLLPPARRLPEAIKTLPSPSSPLLLSIKTTLAPDSAARTAAVKPARPAPTMRTSELMLVTVYLESVESINDHDVRSFNSLAHERGRGLG